MTVSSTTSRNEYNGNGVTDTFAYTFRILDQAHIAVYVGGVLKTITTDYTVSDVGLSGGGDVVLTTPPITGTANVIFLRSVPLTQETDYVENDPFPAESHEDALDKLTMIVQQQQEEIDRSITLSPSAPSGTVVEIPAPAADEVIGWNTAADALENKTLASLSAVALPLSVAEGGTGSTSAADARTALDAQQYNTTLADIAAGATISAQTALGTILCDSLDQSGAYTVVAADKGKVINCTSGTWSLTLTAAATLGDGFQFAVWNNGAGVITIDPNASETIDGATTKALAAGKLAIVYCDGTRFITVGSIATGAGSGLDADLLDGVNGADYASFASVSAGTYYVGNVASATLNSGTGASKMLSIRCPGTGTYRVAHTHQGSSSDVTITRIYKNGSAFGTTRTRYDTTLTLYTEDLSFTKGDLIQLYADSSGGTATISVAGIRLGISVAPAVPTETIVKFPTATNLFAE